MNLFDYKGIWVYAEHSSGKFNNISLELLGKGRELADQLNTKLTAVLLGNNVNHLAEELLIYGADEVIYAEDKSIEVYTTDAYTKVLCNLINEKKPEILLIGASFTGRDLSPRIAARLSTGVTTDCTDLTIDINSRILEMIRPAYGGLLMNKVICENSRPQIATVRPGVFNKPTKSLENIDLAHIRKIKVHLKQDDLRVVVKERLPMLKEIVDITEAEFIVSGGRGVGSKEGFKLLERLAQTLGGTIAGSRGAVHNGWIDIDRQIGQTGKTVRPKVYIAVGISGAMHHISGMQDSKYIIAINTDDTAPIMDIANLGIVGDYQVIVPEIISAIKKIKNDF